MPPQEKYNIILIEPSPVIQKGIKILLEAASNFHITDTFIDYPSFENAQLKPNFQVVLINPAIINFHKHFSVKNLFSKYPDVIIAAILYNYVNSETINNFDGVLDIYNSGSQLIKKLTKCIETTYQNKNKNNTDNIDLSDREKEILISVAIGLTNKEIADKHNISVHTVISHRKNISRKIGIKTVSGLTIYAIFNNLISEDDLYRANA